MGNAAMQATRTRAPRLRLSSVAWQAATGLSFEEWADQGRRLGTLGRTAGWWIGDWLIFGNDVYGERYARAKRITGYDVQTLMNMVYVASRFEISRRRETLSWSHHAEVAALPPEDQDRWLDRAEADRLSVKCLRDALRYERRANRRSPDELPVETPEPSPAGSDTIEAQDAAGLTCPVCGHSFQHT